MPATNSSRCWITRLPVAALTLTCSPARPCPACPNPCSSAPVPSSRVGFANPRPEPATTETIALLLSCFCWLGVSGKPFQGMTARTSGTCRSYPNRMRRCLGVKTKSYNYASSGTSTVVNPRFVFKVTSLRPPFDEGLRGNYHWFPRKPENEEKLFSPCEPGRPPGLLAALCLQPRLRPFPQAAGSRGHHGDRVGGDAYAVRQAAEHSC